MLASMKRYPNADLAGRIKSALEDADVSQADLARACGVTDQAVHDWVMTGRVAKQHLPTICAITGKTLEYLLVGLKPWRRLVAIAAVLITPQIVIAIDAAQRMACVLCKIVRSLTSFRPIGQQHQYSTYGL